MIILRVCSGGCGVEEEGGGEGRDNYVCVYVCESVGGAAASCGGVVSVEEMESVSVKCRERQRKKEGEWRDVKCGV